MEYKSWLQSYNSYLLHQEGYCKRNETKICRVESPTLRLQTSHFGSTLFKTTKHSGQEGVDTEVNLTWLPRNGREFVRPPLRPGNEGSLAALKKAQQQKEKEKKEVFVNTDVKWKSQMKKKETIVAS